MILIKQNVEFNRAYISRVAGNLENHIIEGGINQWEVKSEGLIQERNVLGNVSPVDSPNGGLINQKTDSANRSQPVVNHHEDYKFPKRFNMEDGNPMNGCIAYLLHIYCITFCV